MGLSHSIVSRGGEGEISTAALRIALAGTQPLGHHSHGPYDPVRSALEGASLAEPLKILLVDDDELILEAVTWLLESQGHLVTVAASGQEGLELLQGGLRVDLMIVDQNMPGLSGVETLGQVRAFLPELPVLVATGYRDEALTALVETHPRTLLIHKPLRMPDFVQALARLEGLGPGSSTP